MGKSKILVLAFIALLVSGCSSPSPKPDKFDLQWRGWFDNDEIPPLPIDESTKPTARQSVGRPMVNAGQWVGKNGMVVMVVGALNPLTWPLVPVGISVMVVALPMYYGGCALAGEKPEKSPFEM